MQIKIGVVVPTLTNKEGGYEALASIKSNLDIFWTPIIIDNWRENRVLAESWNLGIETAIDLGCDYILIINDDVLFSPWTLTGLVQAYKAVPEVGMVTGMNVRGSMQPHDIFNIEIPSWASHNYAESPDFACFMLTPDTFSKVGKFDENFRPAYFEDNDYHYRMSLAGIKAIMTNWAPYYHYGSQTQNKYIDIGQPVVNSIQFENNRAYYEYKWGGSPGQETYINPYGDTTKSLSMWKHINQIND